MKNDQHQCCVFEQSVGMYVTFCEKRFTISVSALFESTVSYLVASKVKLSAKCGHGCIIVNDLFTLLSLCLSKCYFGARHSPRLVGSVFICDPLINF